MMLTTSTDTGCVVSSIDLTLSTASDLNMRGVEFLMSDETSVILGSVSS